MKYLFALLLFAVSWLYTSNTHLNPKHGDSFVYLHAAQTFSEGRGFLNYPFTKASSRAVIGAPHAPLTTFPPLYPVTLALFGADIAAARVLNALTLFATLSLMWVLYGDYGLPVGVRVASLAAYLLIMVEGNLLIEASSETLFYPLVLAFLYALPRVKDNRWLLLAILLAISLPLTRYVGIALVAVGALYVLSRRGLLWAAVYALPSALCIGLWFVRNIVLTGALTGNSLPGDYAFPQTLIDTLEVIFQWTKLILGFSLLFCLPGLYRFWRLRILSFSSQAASTPPSTHPQLDS